jgi:hypothetical protein
MLQVFSFCVDQWIWWLPVTLFVTQTNSCAIPYAIFKFTQYCCRYCCHHHHLLDARFFNGNDYHIGSGCCGPCMVQSQSQGITSNLFQDSHWVLWVHCSSCQIWQLACCCCCRHSGIDCASHQHCRCAAVLAAGCLAIKSDLFTVTTMVMIQGKTQKTILMLF